MKKLPWLVATVALTAAMTVARAQSQPSTTTTHNPETGTVTTETVRDGNTVTTEREATTTTAPQATENTDQAIIDPMNGQMAATPIPPPRGDDGLYAHTHTYRTRPGSGAGIGVMVGGGVNNFTQSDVRDRTEIGGGWDATLVFGTRSIIGFEASYVGTMNNINAFGLSGDTKLLGTGASGVMRLNFTTATIQPYLLGGIGYKHYALSGERFNVSGIHNDDNLMEIPMGGGFAIHGKGLMVDARGMYNYAVNSELFDNAPGVGSSPALHNWGARVSLGFEL